MPPPYGMRITIGNRRRRWTDSACGCSYTIWSKAGTRSRRTASRRRAAGRGWPPARRRRSSPSASGVSITRLLAELPTSLGGAEDAAPFADVLTQHHRRSGRAPAPCPWRCGSPRGRSARPCQAPARRRRRTRAAPAVSMSRSGRGSARRLASLTAALASALSSSSRSSPSIPHLRSWPAKRPIGSCSLSASTSAGRGSGAGRRRGYT